MSKELIAIYLTEEVRIVEDVDLTVDIIEKIVTNISPENVHKTPEVKKSFNKSSSQIVMKLFYCRLFVVTQ